MIDVVIGNPPYQFKDNGFGASARPIYNLFIEKANNITNRFNAMIVPARWYATGKGLDQFRKAMLSDKRISKIIDYPDSKECFKGVDVEGGICILLIDSNNVDGQYFRNFIEDKFYKRYFVEFDTLIRCNKAVNIINKIDCKNTLSERVLGSNSFGMNTNFDDFDDDGILIYRRGGTNHLEENKISRNSHLIDKYKVISPKANGDRPKNKKVIGNIIVTGKRSACTMTYLILGYFDNIEEANNYQQYLKTKFVRYLISQIKLTQDVSKKVFKFVPEQDFTKSWTDKELYKKYGLDVDEIEHIEKSIRSMD